MYLLASDVQTFVCLLPLQMPGSMTRDPGNTLFSEHLSGLVYIFPFQNILNWIALWLSQL